MVTVGVVNVFMSVAAARVLGEWLAPELVAVVASYLNGTTSTDELLFAQALLPFAADNRIVVCFTLVDGVTIQCVRLVNGLPHAEGNAPSFVKTDLLDGRVRLGQKLAFKWHDMGGPDKKGGRPLGLFFSCGLNAFYNAYFPNGTHLYETETGFFQHGSCFHRRLATRSGVEDSCQSFNCRSSSCKVCSSKECQFVNGCIQSFMLIEQPPARCEWPSAPSDYTIDWFSVFFKSSRDGE